MNIFLRIYSNIFEYPNIGSTLLPRHSIHHDTPVTFPNIVSIFIQTAIGPKTNATGRICQTLYKHLLCTVHCHCVLNIFHSILCTVRRTLFTKHSYCTVCTVHCHSIMIAKVLPHYSSVHGMMTSHQMLLMFGSSGQVFT